MYKEALQNVVVNEYYWINQRGCHYSLTPIDEKDRQFIRQFWVDTSSLRKARQEAKKWIETQKRLGYKIIVERREM